MIAEVGSGGTNSAGQSQYIYLPTGNGPMPIAAVDQRQHLCGAQRSPEHAQKADQRRWASGLAVGLQRVRGGQAARRRSTGSPILDGTPNPGTTSISEVKFNLRYPGQYADEESGPQQQLLPRSYDTRTGRYSQPDPIGLDGGWNRFGYVDAEDPIRGADPFGPANSGGHRVDEAKALLDLPPAPPPYRCGSLSLVGAAVIGLAGEVGLATAPQFDDACFYDSSAGVAGPRLVAACGIILGRRWISFERCLCFKGVTWFGGAGLVGAGQIPAERLDANARHERWDARSVWRVTWCRLCRLRSKNVVLKEVICPIVRVFFLA